jgi:hypothetical protein
LEGDPFALIGDKILRVRHLHFDIDDQPPQQCDTYPPIYTMYSRAAAPPTHTCPTTGNTPADRWGTPCRTRHARRFVPVSLMVSPVTTPFACWPLPATCIVGVRDVLWGKLLTRMYVVIVVVLLRLCA